MTYSVIGVLSILIHIIVNFDIFRKNEGKQFTSLNTYRLFLICVIAYHLTDAFWGILYEYKLIKLVYADTVLYFISMALSVFAFTVFVIQYLERKNTFRRIMLFFGVLFFASQIVALVINFFTPVMFFFDKDGEYIAGSLRYAAFGIQIFMFLLATAYTIIVSVKSSGTVKRRHLTIGIFGLSMTLAISAQIFYPLLPLYSIGYMLGCCVLHTFVVQDEKEEYIQALNTSLTREAQQKKELEAAKRLVLRDALTGVKSKQAHVDVEELYDRRIEEKSVSHFALVVFDVNGLKSVNDTLGHEAGDEYIINSCRIICNVFKHSPVFRIGGDEFVTILEGKDYDERQSLLNYFNTTIDENLRAGKGTETVGFPVVSAGMSEFDKDNDKAYRKVFVRADEAMYERKHFLKKIKSNIN